MAVELKKPSTFQQYKTLLRKDLEQEFRTKEMLTSMGIYALLVIIVYGAVLSIIALIDVPICFMVTRLIPSSIHPVVVREGGMSADMGITLMFCLVGIMLIGFALYRFRFRQVRLTERVEALKEQLED